MKQFKAPKAVQPFALTIDGFRALYPSSRASVSMWIRMGELPSFKDGARRLIPYDGAREFVKRRAAAGGAISPEVSAQKSAAGKKGRAAQLEGSV
jgi:hypothetical protein